VDPGAGIPPGAAIVREAGILGRLAAPIVGGQLALMGLNFTDTVMAGRLGAPELAAVAVGSSTWSSVHLFLLGILLAVPPNVSQMVGAGRRRAVGPFVRQALWVGLGVGLAALLVTSQLRPLLELLRVQAALVPTIEGYLRALCWGIPAWSIYLVLRFTSDGLGETRPVLYFALLGLPLNVAANYLFMYGGLGLPALGAVGCGYATALVWTTQAVGMALWVARRPEYRGLHVFARLDRPHWRRIGEILRVGLPIALGLFSEGGMFTAAALILGSLGTVAVAGHQVALNFCALTFMIPLGLAMAVTVRVGHAVGRRDPAAVRFSAAVGTGMAMLSQLATATVMVLAPRWVGGVYTRDPAVLDMAARLLALAALFQLSDGVQVSAAAALRGIKDTRVPMLIVAVAYWWVGIPLGAWLTFGAGRGAAGMWLGMIAGLTVAAVLLALRFHLVSRRLYATLPRR